MTASSPTPPLHKATLNPVSRIRSLVYLFASDILNSGISRSYSNKQFPKHCTRSQQQTEPQSLTATGKRFLNLNRVMYTYRSCAPVKAEEKHQRGLHTNKAPPHPVFLFLPRHFTKTSTVEPGPRTPRERAAATLASARWQALWLTLGSRAAVYRTQMTHKIKTAHMGLSGSGYNCHN